MPAGALTFRFASEADVDRVIRLLGDCIAAMRRAGIDQWDDVYPDRATLLADAREGAMYLGSSDEEPLAGLFVLNGVQNPEYDAVPWTIRAGRIAVVHRLMVEPRLEGQGIARALMRHAEDLAARQGYQAVRLDAFSGNPRALRLYEGLGYRDAGSVTFRKGVFRCYEKSLEPPA